MVGLGLGSKPMAAKASAAEFDHAAPSVNDFTVSGSAPEAQAMPTSETTAVTDPAATGTAIATVSPNGLRPSRRGMGCGRRVGTDSRVATGRNSGLSSDRT